MTKRLFVEASPRGRESKSIQIAGAYLAALRANNTGLKVETIKLWNADLPAFDGDKVVAKENVILGRKQNAAQKTAWDQVVEIANRFISADRYLFAVPMWNGSILTLILRMGKEDRHSTIPRPYGNYTDRLLESFVARCD